MAKNEYWKIAAANTPDDLWHVVDIEIDHRRKKIPEIIPGEVPRYILYGAGRFAFDVLRAWHVHGVTPVYAVDSDSKKWNKFIGIIPIYKPDQLLSENEGCIVIVAAMITHEIEDHLNSIGLPYLFAERDGSIDCMPGHKLATRRADFERVFHALADEKSRETLMAVAKARMFQRFHFPMCGNVFTSAVACYPQYFPKDVIALRNSEYFVDCGTFDGETIVSFFSEAQQAESSGCFKAVGFEVDAGNARKTIETLKRFGLEYVEIISNGVGATEGKVDLTEFHTCDNLPKQDVEVSLTTLDKALAGHLPTFIKMDVEGYELDALRGAAEIISVAKPRLAICIYHETAHLLDVPIYLIDMAGESKIFMRHHSAGTLWETVCYCIPN